MTTIENIMFSGIIHTVIHNARLEYIRSKNIIFPRHILKTIGTNNATFYVDENLHTIQEAMTEYNYSDLRPTDNVLDIGACIGAFSLTVHKNVNHVYAIEPLMADTLKKNIELNNAKNITVLECALGSGETHVSWNGINKKVIGLSLEDIIRQCGAHIDFIKCDCEGGEWCITLSDIFNIRRIEAEVHNLTRSYIFKNFEDLLISSGFDYTKRVTNMGKTMLISAKNRYID